MSDKILLQNIMFYGFHGVYEHEREIGQRFYLDVELTMDFSKASESDDLSDTINYITVHEFIRNIVENKRFNLLEALAVHLAETLAVDKVLSATVRVRKPNVPLHGHIDFVQVEATRHRK